MALHDGHGRNQQSVSPVLLVISAQGCLGMIARILRYRKICQSDQSKRVFEISVPAAQQLLHVKQHLTLWSADFIPSNLQLKLAAAASLMLAVASADFIPSNLQLKLAVGLFAGVLVGVQILSQATCN